MGDYPQSETDITTRINTITNQLDTFLASPTKFTEQIQGSLKVSIPQYIAALQKERDQLQIQLQNVPFIEESDLEMGGPRF